MQQPACPFCRQPYAENEEDIKKNFIKRIDAKDPVALYYLGKEHYVKGNYESAFKYYTKAADLGDVDAHYPLSEMYREGRGVEKDGERELYHLEEAAIAGHPGARFNLACYEVIHGRDERAAKHWIIAGNLGDDESIQKLKKVYKHGFVSKEEFAAALRGHHAAVNAVKSPQREEVKQHHRKGTCKTNLS